MTLFEFAQWCFRTRETGALTFLIAWFSFDGIAKIARALRGGPE